MTREIEPTTPQQRLDWLRERKTENHQAQRELQEYNNWVFEIYERLQNTVSPIRSISEDTRSAK